MISDNERREVARRLREKKAECEERGYPWMCDDLILALGYDHDYEAGDEIFDLLADFIEPSCDRDALLELADEMQKSAEWCDRISEKSIVWAGVIRGYSERIREALGVEDGAF